MFIALIDDNHAFGLVFGKQSQHEPGPDNRVRALALPSPPRREGGPQGDLAVGAAHGGDVGRGVGEADGVDAREELPEVRLDPSFFLEPREGGIFLGPIDPWSRVGGGI